MKVSDIVEIIRDKRKVHPELWGALGWHGFLRILEREGVDIMRRALPRPAQLIFFHGRWTILLDTESTTRHLHHGLHELGHLWLHHDKMFERHERVYNMSEWEGPDPREDESEIFAELVIKGPGYYREDPVQVSGLQPLFQ